jgi:hypothetical protein
VPRDLDTATATEITSNAIRLALLLEITFKSQTCYVSTLPFNLNWNGVTWVGVGSLGQIGGITEATDVQAYGTSVSLSGIDANLLNECMTDIQLAAPAILYMAFFDAGGNILGMPTVAFAGQVDKPQVSAGPTTITISLNLESEMINLQRGQMRRLTNADQHIDYPDDTAFTWVPLLNFMALKWGTS